MPTPKETTKKLGDLLTYAFKRMVSVDLQDPDFWADTKIDQGEFAKALREDGAMVQISLTFNNLNPKDGLAVLSPREFGLTTADPEVFMVDVQLEPFGE